MAHRKIDDVVTKEMSARQVGRRMIDGKRVLIGIRIGEHQKKLLHNHFAEKGLELSTGIRSVLYDYIKQNKLQ